MIQRRFGTVIFVAILAAGLCLAEAAQFVNAQKEEFLLAAEVLKTKTLSQGVIRSLRATLSDGQLTHDASVQDIDVYKQVFTSALGTELNFKDTYKANIAAYRLGKMLGLGGMIPPSVARRVKGTTPRAYLQIERVTGSPSAGSGSARISSQRPKRTRT